MNPIKMKLLMLKLILLTLFKVVHARLKLEWERGSNKLCLYSDFVANTRGEIGSGVVGTLVGIMVSLLIAIIVVQNLVNSQTPDENWSTEANDTWDALQDNIWVALTLLVIVPIVVGAIIILSYVRRGM